MKLKASSRSLGRHKSLDVSSSKEHCIPRYIHSDNMFADVPWRSRGGCVFLQIGHLHRLAIDVTPAVALREGERKANLNAAGGDRATFVCDARGNQV